MRQDGHDDHERASWRDVEMLPFYILAGMLLFVAIRFLGDISSDFGRETGLKALLAIGLIGVHRIWTASARTD